MVGTAEVEKLKTCLRGEIIQPGDEGCDEARKVYNGMIDKRPSLIARCVDVADVVSAVNSARENDILLAVRGGGHNGGGLGVCDDGLVIDLSQMRGVRVDPKARTVRVEASLRPVRKRTQTCSGPCAAAEATSALSLPSCSGCIQSATLWVGRLSGIWTRLLT